MKLKIVQAGDPILRKQSRALTKDEITDSLDTTLNRIDARHNARRAGLSALPLDPSSPSRA